jgi:PTS system mannitol-specific IIC component
MEEQTLRVKIQRLGRFLSGMVMPNIGAFIAWGLITALFIPTGWFPNEQLAQLVGPMIVYMLPLLIGFSGGQMVGGARGAIVGTVVTMGVIVGSDVPMFMGAMLAGPLGGWVIKKFDQWADGKVKAGFEMLVNNFSAGIIGAILAIIAFFLIGPFMAGVSHGLSSVVAWIVSYGLLPLVSLVVEPAKVLFLNNAMNHGIFTPLGAEQVAISGKSIFYLIETNPGPGLGVLLAYFFFGKGTAKASSPGAMIIHFLGGIHEIYFPFVLMIPSLFFAVMFGGATGVLINVLFDTGLSSVASPGSILAIMLVTAKGSHLGVLLSVLGAAAVSFLIASPIVKASSKENVDDAFSQAQEQKDSMKQTAKGVSEQPILSSGGIKKIIVACDAGLGSSAMGATMFRKKLKEAGLELEVAHSAIDSIPLDTGLIITQEKLAERARNRYPQIPVREIKNFMNGAFYDELIKELKSQK